MMRIDHDKQAASVKRQLRKAFERAEKQCDVAAADSYSKYAAHICKMFHDLKSEIAESEHQSLVYLTGGD